MITTYESEPEGEGTTIAIDGSHGEGGGQVIRTSLSLAAITGRTIEISNIRAKRSRPGLQAQHVTSVRAAAAICNAALHGDDLGSSFVRFAPGRAVNDTPREYRFDVAAARGGGSAGASTLVAQTILAPMLMIGSNESVQATILGGTHVPMAPVADYLEAVYALLLNRMGAAVNIRTIRAGYFPRGGGMLEITVSGASLAPIDLAERGRLVRLRGFITTSGLPGGVAERGAVTLRKELKGYGVPVTIEKRDLDGNGEGAAVMLAAECATGIGGWSSLGERGKPIERVAFETVNGFKRWYATNTSVDEHLADQLPLLCACAGGVSRWHTPVVTEHLRTVLWVVSKFVPVRATITEREDGSGEVEIRGS